MLSRAAATKYKERIPTLEEMRARLNLNSYKFSTQDETSGNSDNATKMEEIKQKKLELMAGNKNFLKGIYTGTNSSSYQEVYR